MESSLSLTEQLKDIYKARLIILDNTQIEGQDLTESFYTCSWACYSLLLISSGCCQGVGTLLDGCPQYLFTWRYFRRDLHETSSRFSFFSYHIGFADFESFYMVFVRPLVAGFWNCPLSWKIVVSNSSIPITLCLPTHLKMFFFVFSFMSIISLLQVIPQLPLAGLRST